MTERKIRGVILHHTGVGLIQQFKKKGGTDEKSFARFARDYYMKAENKPHAIIGANGVVMNIADMDDVVRHTGKANSQMEPTSYWKARWPGKKHPSELLGGTLWQEGSANDITYGIEVLPSFANPLGRWTLAQYIAIKETAKMVHAIVNSRLPLEEFVIGHYDANPNQRERNGKPWDPWEAQWSPSIARALFA